MSEPLKDFWNNRPCNSRHSDAEPGSFIYSQQVSERRYKVEPHIPGFAQFTRWGNKKVLEIGCGIGSDGKEFALAGAEYTGIDMSEKSLEIARKRFRSENLSGIFHNIDATTLTEHIQDSFDLVYSFGVIHHTAEPERIMKQIAKVMHKGSELRMMLYAENSWKDAMIDCGLEHYEAQEGVPIVRTYSEISATTLLKGAGLRVKEMRRDFIFPYEVESYRRGEHIRHPWFDCMPLEMRDVLARRFGQHLLIVGELNNQKETER